MRFSATTPSEFFSLSVRFWWGVALLLQPWTGFGLTEVDRQSAAPLTNLLGFTGVGLLLVISAGLHAYSILWEHRRLRLAVLLTVVAWWSLVTVGTVYIAGPGVRAVITALFGVMMAWAYWRRSGARGTT